ncbi:MAG: ferrochelatase [Janthinobacterium lividum]
MPRSKLAIVLFNLGGPDRPEAIKPFLLNLFSDPAILRVPFFVRPLLARIIAGTRVKPATENYAILGGRSPLLELTEGQARSLEAALPDLDAKCFIAMRYWHPFADEVAPAVKAWAPDEILLLPLYPQYSTTTTGSSLTDWREAAARSGLVAPTTTLCCYHSDPGFVAASAAMLRRAYDDARAATPEGTVLRVLFSAHGLPESIVRSGDPYQFQIERTAAAMAKALGIDGLDWSICFQSRATPQKWLEPSTEQALEKAAHDKVAVLVVPLAFVSEHSETLVELDVEYREVAEKLGIHGYFRAPAQNSDAGFIDALATLVRTSMARGPGLCSFRGGRTCPKQHKDCPHARAALPASLTPAPDAPAETAAGPSPQPVPEREPVSA